ncbi:MAG: hypothetical protein IPM29_20380 [Planctomycetes bacterium]|nr:hypothetical protein [Planctomycetota bacterium]
MKSLSLFLAGGCAMLAGSAVGPLPDGNNTIGFMHREVGRVDYAIAAIASGSTGTITLSGVPPGAEVLHAWLYADTQRQHGYPSGLTFAGQPVTLSLIGTQSAVASRNTRYAYRADVTSLVPGNGTYSWSLGAHGFGAGMLVIYRDDSLVADYDIEVHDGVYGGSSADGAHQTWAPITFTGFVVDGTAPAEMEIALYMEGGQAGYSENYLFGVGTNPLVVIAVNPAASAREWDVYDVSSFVSGGETAVRATVYENTDAVNWMCGVVRTRISPPVYDTTPPEVAIAIPADGAVLAASPADVLVTVRDESAATLESTPSLPFDPSSFPGPTAGEATASWPLVEGSNALTVVARDAYGNADQATATVVLDTVPPRVTIAAPADGAWLRTPIVELVVDVVDATATEVASSPAGVDATLPPGGGTARGDVALTEGENLLSATARDAALHAAGTSLTVWLDTVAPVLEWVAPLPGAVLAEEPAHVVVRGTDAGPTTVHIGTATVSLPPGGGLAAADVALLPGTNRIPVLVIDAAGNQVGGELPLVLDLDAPIVEILAPADGTVLGRGESPVEVVASIDDLTATSVTSTPTGIDASLPAGGGLASGPIPLVEGANTITVRATDATGRVGSDAVQVVLDTTAPELAITSPVDGDAVRGGIDFHATATDPAPGSGVARVELLVDGLVVAEHTGPPYELALDTSALADGWHTLAARAVDGKGNDATRSLAVEVDNTLPAIAWTEPTAAAVVGGAFELRFAATDACSGLVRVDQRAGGLPPALVDGSADLDPAVSAATVVGREDTTRWPDGPLALLASARDRAGNECAVTIEVDVDNTAPERCLTAPLDGAVVAGVIELRAEASDPHLASLSILVDGVVVASSACSPLAVPFDTTARLDGAMTVTAVARDVVGNTSASVAHVTLDNVALTVEPSTLNLRSRGGDNSITVRLEGPNVAMLIPTEHHGLELRVPGGNAVPSTAGFAGDDQPTDADHDGVPELTVKFDRQALIAAIRAGLAAGSTPAGGPVSVALFADGSFELGRTTLRIVGS